MSYHDSLSSITRRLWNEATTNQSVPLTIDHDLINATVSRTVNEMHAPDSARVAHPASARSETDDLEETSPQVFKGGGLGVIYTNLADGIDVLASWFVTLNLHMEMRKWVRDVIKRAISTVCWLFLE